MVLGPSSEDVVDAVAVTAQLLGQEQQRRRTDPAADEQAVRRFLLETERTAEGAEDVERRVLPRKRDSSSVPRPRTSKTTSTVPAQPGRRSTRWIENGRRSSRLLSSGIRSAMNCPGAARVHTSGATSVSEWYGSSSRL